MWHKYYRRHRRHFFSSAENQKFFKNIFRKDFAKMFKKSFFLMKKCWKLKKKTFDFLHAFFEKMRTRADENRTKPSETIRNHYETITKPSKKSRMHANDATKPILRACGYIIFNTASADFMVSCVFTSLRDGFVDGFVDPRNRHETITKPSTKPSRNHHIYEILVSGFF